MLDRTGCRYVGSIFCGKCSPGNTVLCRYMRRYCSELSLTVYLYVSIWFCCHLFDCFFASFVVSKDLSENAALNHLLCVVQGCGEAATVGRGISTPPGCIGKGC